MKALPNTRYALASAETWTLIRGAYLSGLSAPTLAARFGISVTALRKRAGREGWTKRQYAATARSGAPRPPSASGSAPAADGPPTEEAVIAACLSPLDIRPGDLARRALANAAQAVRAGQGLAAVRLARAANEIVRLDGVLDWAEEDPAESEARFEASQTMMRQYLRGEALKLAEALFAGEPLPGTYEDLKLELARLEALRSRAAAGSSVSG